MLSLLNGPKVITYSGFYCTIPNRNSALIVTETVSKTETEMADTETETFLSLSLGNNFQQFFSIYKHYQFQSNLDIFKFKKVHVCHYWTKKCAEFEQIRSVLFTFHHHFVRIWTWTSNSISNLNSISNFQIILCRLRNSFEFICNTFLCI